MSKDKEVKKPIANKRSGTKDLNKGAWKIENDLMESVCGVDDFDEESLKRLEDANRKVPLQKDRQSSAFYKNPNVRDEIITNNPVNISYATKKKSTRAKAPDSFVPSKSSLLKDLLTKRLPEQHEEKKDFIPPVATIRQEPNVPLSTITASSTDISSEEDFRVNGKKRINPEDYKANKPHKRMKGDSGYRSGVSEENEEVKERSFEK